MNENILRLITGATAAALESKDPHRLDLCERALSGDLAAAYTVIDRTLPVEGQGAGLRITTEWGRSWRPREDALEWVRGQHNPRRAVQLLFLLAPETGEITGPRANLKKWKDKKC